MLTLLVEQLVASIETPAPTNDTPFSDSAIRHRDRGEKWCSFHQCHEPIRGFHTVARNGKLYYRSGCRAAESAKRVAKNRDRANGVVPITTIQKLAACRERANALLSDKPVPVTKRIGWTLEERQHMLTVLPSRFNRDDAALIWGFTTKLGTAMYIRALVKDGAITPQPRPSKRAPEVYEKTY